MKYGDLVKVDRGLAELLDAKIVNGTADLYFKLQRVAKAIQAENELFQKTQQVALKGVEDIEEQREVMNKLLEEEISTEMPVFTYDELEKFEGMTFKIISLLEPIMEGGRAEVVDCRVSNLGEVMNHGE